jgi:SAM-dependent methyltransferase
MSTSNFQKHTSKNPLQRILLENFYKKLLLFAKEANPQTILDAGCGEGFTLKRLKEKNIGKRHEGVEYNTQAINLGKKLFPALLIKEGNIYSLPYKDNSFDLVICTEVLEHLDNPKKALLEIKRVSRKYILVSVPNEPFFMLANLLRGKNIKRLGNDPEHIKHWTAGGFERFLESSQLKIVKKAHPFPWTLILAEK